MTTVAAQKERAGETPDFSNYSWFRECAIDDCGPCRIINSIHSPSLQAIEIKLARAQGIYPLGSTPIEVGIYSKPGETGLLYGMFNYPLNSLSLVLANAGYEIRFREDPKRERILWLARVARSGTGRNLPVHELKMGQELNWRMEQVYRQWPNEAKIDVPSGLFLFDEQDETVVLALRRGDRLSVFPGRDRIETLERFAVILRRVDQLNPPGVESQEVIRRMERVARRTAERIKPTYNLHMAPLNSGLNGLYDELLPSRNGRVKELSEDDPKVSELIKPLAPWPRMAGVSTSFPVLPSNGIKATKVFLVNRPPISNYGNGLMVPHRK